MKLIKLFSKQKNGLKGKKISLDKWPEMVLQFAYRHGRISSMIKILFPCVLLFIVTIFAQWKKLKVQVFITVASLLGITIMVFFFILINCMMNEDELI